jgi:hypothetical protein
VRRDQPPRLEQRLDTRRTELDVEPEVRLVGADEVGRRLDDRGVEADDRLSRLQIAQVLREARQVGVEPDADEAAGLDSRLSEFRREPGDGRALGCRHPVFSPPLQPGHTI